MVLIEDRDNLIKKWLKEAENMINESVNNELEIETKSDRSDLVTNMDRSIEEMLVGKIRSEYPNDKIVSEEGFGDDPDKIDMSEDTVWFLDPIDGTINFVVQDENYCVMLAVYEKNVGMQAYVFDVSRNKLYWAIKGKGVYCNDELLPKIKNARLQDGLFASNTKFLSNEIIGLNAEILKGTLGIRNIGSAGLEAAELAKGNTAIYITYGLNAWDIAPGIMMVQESGGTVKRFDEKPINPLEKSALLMGTHAAVEEALQIIKNK